MCVLTHFPYGYDVSAGTSATESWSLEFVHQGHWYNPLMGYTSTADPVGQLRMQFNTKQAAVAFAEKQGLSYSIEDPHKKVKRNWMKSYEYNYKWCVYHYSLPRAFQCGYQPRLMLSLLRLCLPQEGSTQEGGRRCLIALL